MSTSTFWRTKGLGNGRFERRPLEQSKTLSIDLPSFRNLDESKSQADELRRTVVRLADFDGDGQSTDLAVLSDVGQLTGWKDLVTDPSILENVTERFLGDLLRRDETVEIDVRMMTEWLFGRASLLMSLTIGQTADVRRLSLRQAG